MKRCLKKLIVTFGKRLKTQKLCLVFNRINSTQTKPIFHTIFLGKSYFINFDKNGLGNILGFFLQTHLVTRPKRRLRSL
jgi:hypothetical protein